MGNPLVLRRRLLSTNSIFLLQIGQSRGSFPLKVFWRYLQEKKRETLLTFLSSFNLSYPFISEDFPTGSAETTLTGMRPNSILVGMVWASILMVTKFLRVSTGKHFFYNRRDVVGDRIFILGKVSWPVILEDLFYGVSF